MVFLLFMTNQFVSAYGLKIYSDSRLYKRYHTSGSSASMMPDITYDTLGSATELPSAL